MPCVKDILPVDSLATKLEAANAELASLTARAVRAEQLLTELQQATCRALYRVNERLDQYVMDEAFGWTNGRFGTDCGEALDALRRAAGVTVRKDDHGFLEFVKDTPRPATP